MILTVGQLRQHLTSGLADAALQTLLDAAESVITDAAGPMLDVVERRWGGYPALVLDRRPEAVATVRESTETADPVTLAATDYRVDGYILHRLTTGTSPGWYWRGLVEVAHTPVDDLAARAVAQVELVKLDLSMAAGVTSERIGDYAVGYGSSSLQEQRERILAPLRPVLVA